jgi:hypothetical protein
VADAVIEAKISCHKTHVQGVVSQPFDFSKQFSERYLPAQKIALKYQ